MHGPRRNRRPVILPHPPPQRPALNRRRHAPQRYPNIDFSTIRIMNVLQRIAICYFFFASILYVYLRMSTRSILWLCGTILVLYFCPDEVRSRARPRLGILEPTTNWSNYIDRHLLAGHMQTPLKEPKSSSALPALVTMLMGLPHRPLSPLQARRLRENCQHLFYGSVCTRCGHIWSIWFPINQKLWTSSLVLLMGGMAMVFLACCYYLVDIRKSTWWTLPPHLRHELCRRLIFSQLGMKTLVAIQITDAAGATTTSGAPAEPSSPPYLEP
jgi:predicted acyltransferase